MKRIDIVKWWRASAAQRVWWLTFWLSDEGWLRKRRRK